MKKYIIGGLLCLFLVILLSFLFTKVFGQTINKVKVDNWIKSSYPGFAVDSMFFTPATSPGPMFEGGNYANYKYSLHYEKYPNLHLSGSYLLGYSGEISRWYGMNLIKNFDGFAKTLTDTFGNYTINEVDSFSESTDAIDPGDAIVVNYFNSLRKNQDKYYLLKREVLLDYVNDNWSVVDKNFQSNARNYNSVNYDKCIALGNKVLSGKCSFGGLTFFDESYR